MMATSNEGIALLALIQNASLLVQLVMAMLLLASLISWTMIFRKWVVIRAAYREARLFEERF